MLTVFYPPRCPPLVLRLWRGDSGQDLIEYAMLAALIAIIAIGAVTAVGTQVNAILWAPAAATF